MPDWLTWATNTSLSVLIVIGVGAFVWKVLWPWLALRFEKSEERIEILTKQFAETMTKQAEATQQVAKNFEEALEEIRNNRRPRKPT